MKKNVSHFDGMIRIILGIVVVASFFVLEGSFRWISLLDIVFIFTVVMKFCPLFLPFGINTRKLLVMIIIYICN